VVVHLYSTFLWTPRICCEGQINQYEKLPLPANLQAISPHFSSHNGEIRQDDAALGLPRRSQIF